jgi:hypothetical protein
MSTYACPCGAVIRSSTFPSPHEAWLHPDDFDAKLEHAFGMRLNELVAAEPVPSRASIDEALSGSIQAVGNSCLAVLECDGCGRLHVHVEPGGARYRTYSPESGSPGLLAAINGAAAAGERDAPLDVSEP